MASEADIKLKQTNLTLLEPKKPTNASRYKIAREILAFICVAIVIASIFILVGMESSNTKTWILVALAISFVIFCISAFYADSKASKLAQK